MTRTLRNIGFRLWLTVLVFIPAGLFVLPRHETLFPGSDPERILFPVVVLIYAIVCFCLDRMAAGAIARHIREAQAWERAGISTKAERSYFRAIRIYDSFLPGLLQTRKRVRSLLFAIARFSLHGSGRDRNLRMATAMYLKMNPADKDLAERWLHRMKSSPAQDPLEQDVLALMAETHSANPAMSALISDIFITSGKKRYEPAKTVHPAPFADKPGFQSAAAAKAGSRKTGRTLEAQRPYTPAAEKNIRKKQPGKKAFAGTIFPDVFGMVFSLLKFLARLFTGALSLFLLGLAWAADSVRHDEKIQFRLKAGVLILISLGLVLMVARTLTHMIQSEPEKKEIVQVFLPPVPKPFTIQVSAYLKKDFADRYAAALIKKSIDASVKQVEGGGKTWFVVRVSEFEDKKTAEAYGQQLKKDGTIDDFFVTNK